MKRTLVCVGGARPNFMKLAPLVRELRSDPDFIIKLVHTGQHYDNRMSGQFFEELGLPEPDYHLNVGSGSHASQTAEIMKRIEPILMEPVDGVVVVGDVNSTVAAALVAKKLLIKVIHVESGLRSFDHAMPEEINRLMTDCISDLLLVTEKSGRQNLLNEGIPAARIEMVGNLMIDTLRGNLERANKESKILVENHIPKNFGLVTLHRPANVDNPETLAELMQTLETISSELPLWFPVHPRTRGVIDKANIPMAPNIHLLEPLGYVDFLKMMSSASVVLTDSGGVQEETTALGVPCLTLRENTERPVTIDEGTNTLAGITRDGILAAWSAFKQNPKRGRIPELWDGQAALRCRQALRKFWDMK